MEKEKNALSWLAEIDPNKLISLAKEEPILALVIIVTIVICAFWYFKNSKEDKNIEINQKVEGNIGNIIQVGRNYNDKSKRK